MKITTRKLTKVSVPTSILRLPAQGTESAKATVVCLHGFPDNKESFKPLMRLLATEGYDVWVPTMPGYQTDSAEAQKSYYLNDLASTIAEWIEHDLAGKDIHIIGHDWGSPIATLLVAEHPNTSCVTIKSLVSLAIPPLQYLKKGLVKYPEQIIASRYIAFFQLRGVAELAIRRSNFKYLKKLWQSWSPTWNIPARSFTQLEKTFSQTNVLQASLQYYRSVFDFISKKGKSNFKQAANISIAIPCLFLSGREDHCMSVRQFAPFQYEPKHYPAGAEHHFVRGGHFCQQEAPDEVSEWCIKFWKQLED